MVSIGRYILKKKKENFVSQQENDKNLDGKKDKTDSSQQIKKTEQKKPLF